MISFKLIKYILRNNKNKKKTLFLLKNIKKNPSKRLYLLFKLNHQIKRKLKNVSLKKKVYLIKYIYELKNLINKKRKNKEKYLLNKTSKLFFRKKKESDGSFLYKKLLGLMTKKGLKSKSFNILQKSLHLASIKMHITIKKLLNNLYKKLKIFVEPKTIKKRKKNYLVPFPITKKRSFYLASKWILNCLKKKKKVNIEKLLSKEITRTLTKKKSNSLKYKRINILNSLKNKSNLHFRW
jgi:ribosomal protein S7